MNIRKIKKEEMPELFELYSHYTDNSENLIPITDSQYKQIYSDIEANPGVNYFVMEVDNKIVSACILSITPSILRGGSGYGVLEHMVTHSDYRRRGLGQKILEFSLNFAWYHGCTEVMLLSGTNLEVAHKLYEGLGFDKFQRKGFIKLKPKK
ncbi:MAG TPA: GNAT family N-acetyltransferase [Victivallales bacterium]|nr:GNAT family N-acetyltransferase [Victivallales bacterium]